MIELQDLSGLSESEIRSKVLAEEGSIEISNEFFKEENEGEVVEE